MTSGITIQALRRHRWTLAGPFATQTVVAATVGAMVMTARALDAAPLTDVERAGAQVAGVRDATEVFLGVSVYLSIVVVGVTMALALAGQLRDIALLRTVGATPGQIRRSAAWQAAIVAVPACVLGTVLAVPAGALWVALLRGQGFVPDQVAFRPSPVALPVAVGIVVGTSVVGTLIAAARTSRLRPAVALTEVTSGRRPVGRARTVAGVTLAGGGAALSVVLSVLAPSQVGDAAFFVMLAQCVGVGLLGPPLLHAVGRAGRRVVPEGLGRVVVDDVAAMSRALAAALVPLVLATAFAFVKIAAQATTAAVTGETGQAVDVWIDMSGTAIYATFAGIAALNCFVTVTVGRRRDLAALQLAGATRRDVMRITAIEAVLVAAVAMVVAVVVATVTLAPTLHAGLGVWLPRVPLPVMAAGVALVVTVTTCGLVIPAALVTRRQPTGRALAA